MVIEYHILIAFEVERIPKGMKKFIGKNIITNIYRIEASNSKTVLDLKC